MSETIRLAVDVTGVAIALVLLIITIIKTMLPKDAAVAAMISIWQKVPGWLALLLSWAGFVAIAFFDAPRAGLLFVVICVFILSWQFLRAPGPATRAEILMIVVAVAAAMGFALLNQLARLIDLVEQLSVSA